MATPPFNRRTLLAGAGGAALLGAAAGCSTGGAPEENSASANTAVKLPTYVAYEGVKADLPGTEQGVEPGLPPLSDRARDHGAPRNPAAARRCPAWRTSTPRCRPASIRTPTGRA